MKTKFALLMFSAERDLSASAKAYIANALSLFDGADMDSIKIIEFAPNELEKVCDLIKNNKNGEFAISEKQKQGLKNLLRIFGYLAFPKNPYDLRIKIAEAVVNPQKRIALVAGLNFINNTSQDICKSVYAKRIAFSETIYKTLKEATKYYFE